MLLSSSFNKIWLYTKKNKGFIFGLLGKLVFFGSWNFLSKLL